MLMVCVCVLAVLGPSARERAQHLMLTDLERRPPPSSSPPRPALFFSLLYLRQPMNFLSPDAVMTSVPSQSSFFFFFLFFQFQTSASTCTSVHPCSPAYVSFFFACFFFHTARFLFILKNVFLKWFQAIVFSLRPECVVCNERDGEQCGDWREKENEP